MKVLILSPSYPRYEEDTRVPFVRAYAKEIAKHCEVTVITSSAPETKEFSQIMDNVKIHRFRYFFPQRMQRLSYTNSGGILESYRKSILAKIQMPLFLLAFFFKSLKYSRDAEIIHAQWMPAGLVGIFLKWIYKKPLICEVRGAERSMPRYLARFIAKRIDVFIAWTPELQDFLHSLGRNSRIEDIKGMIDFEKLELVGDVTGFKKEFGLENKKVITFLGRLVYMKNPLGFVRAVPYVIEKRKDVRFLIIGDGELREDVKKLVDELSVNEFVIMTRARSDVNTVLRATDIFVGLSPICHTYSATIMEAMYLGVPCILDTPKYTKESFIDKEYAYLVRNDEPKELADAILDLLDDNILHQKLSKNGQIFVKKLGFEKEVIVKKSLELYKRMV
ncbi:MAG: glycosyltransferase family 4 protein [Nanoarchaeota archaeon]